jgi:imidazoleglycerol phosphate dehydratase HisB
VVLRLMLNYDESLSNSAVDFSSRRYNTGKEKPKKKPRKFKKGQKYDVRVHFFISQSASSSVVDGRG